LKLTCEVAGARAAYRGGPSAIEESSVLVHFREGSAIEDLVLELFAQVRLFQCSILDLTAGYELQGSRAAYTRDNDREQSEQQSW